MCTVRAHLRNTLRNHQILRMHCTLCWASVCIALHHRCTLEVPLEQSRLVVAIDCITHCSHCWPPIIESCTAIYKHALMHREEEEASAAAAMVLHHHCSSCSSNSVCGDIGMGAALAPAPQPDSSIRSRSLPTAWLGTPKLGVTHNGSRWETLTSAEGNTHSG